MLDAHCGEESPFWDWSSVWFTDKPDFTACFQKTVLVWIPCGFLWLYLPVEMYLIKKKRRRRIPWTFLNGMKLFLSICLSILSAIELFHWVILSSVYSVDVALVNYYSNLTKFVTYVAASVLIAFHRLYGIRSSGFLFSFWVILSFTTIISVRTWFTLHLNENSSSDILLYTICVICVPIVLAQLILSSLTDAPPIGSVRYKNACPVIDASLFSRITFSWFDKMAVLGHKRALTRNDLWQLNDEYCSDHVYPRMQQNWQNVKLRDLRSGKKKSSILPALVRTFWIPFIQVGLIQLIANLCDFVTPTVLGYLIDFVSNDEPTWRGYFYCSILFFVGLVAAIFYAHVDWITFRVGMKLRAGMISLIYRKAVRLSGHSKLTSSTGEIVNLISVDSERLHGVFFQIHACWVGILQVVIAIYMLWQELGPSVCASFSVFALMLPANAYVASKFNSVITKQMKFKDKRIKLMNEILAGIKVLKLYAWEKSFFSQVSQIRNKELKVLRTNEYLTACVEFIYSNIPILLTLVTFVTYVLVDEGNILDAKKVFVSISLFNILNFPILIIPMMVVDMVQARVSLRRLNKYFNEEELDPQAVSHDTNAAHAVIIENGTLAWDHESDSVLNEINFVCPEGQLVAVLGPVGSGKSSLISAVLGEMEKRSGYINVKGSIAYVAQQAWIQNATLRDNITFGSIFDQNWYDKVIEACALKADLELLPAGDQTEIGERGINLSGGQKQRVSFARAVYSNVDVYLLDDPLSAVDAHVGKHIFDNVIGPSGLLKQQTRLFVTNGIHYLSQTDCIAVLNKGFISEVGSYEQLINKRGAFAEFIQTHLSDQQYNSTDENKITDNVKRMISVESNVSATKSVYFEDGNDGVAVAPARRSLSRSLSQESAVVKLTSREQLYDEKSLADKQNSATLIEEEEVATGTVSWTVYWNYIRSLGLWTVFVVVVANFAVVSCDAYSNIWLSIWSQDPPVKNDDLRNRRLGVYGALGFSQVVCLLIGCLALASGSIRASREIHNSLLKNVLLLPLSFFDTTPVGRILNRFSKDIALVDDSIAQNIFPILSTTMEALAVMVVISMSTPLILIIVAPIALIYYFVQRFYISTSRQLKRLVFVAHSPVFSQFSETLFGTSTIRAYNRTSDFILESERLVDEFHTCAYPSLAANRWLGIRLLTIGQLINFFAAFFAVVSRSVIDPGTMGLTVSYAANIVFALIILVRTMCELEANIVAIERIIEYTNTPTEAPHEIENTKLQKRWPYNGIIEFRNYSTRYRPGLDLVLDGITFLVKQEEKIGIVGRTGAGKSSLAMGLFRIVEPSNGKIIIDGIDTSQLGLSDLRSCLTVIPQDPVLFSGSLRMNLDPFDKYSDQQVWRALEHSHLKSFVLLLPDRLMHTINEGGENLSVGQRQLICLARALLRKSKVLVLDEATAAVDLETDEVIQSTIRKEFVDCTVITIAHRLNTIMDSTRIMVLDSGKIKEFDTPDNLLQDSKSLFYSLAKDAGIV